MEKYRPVFLDDIVGNTETIERLKIIAKDGNMPHVIISGIASLFPRDDHKVKSEAELNRNKHVEMVTEHDVHLTQSYTSEDSSVHLRDDRHHIAPSEGDESNQVKIGKEPPKHSSSENLSDKPGFFQKFVARHSDDKFVKFLKKHKDNPLGAATSWWASIFFFKYEILTTVKG